MRLTMQASSWRAAQTCVTWVHMAPPDWQLEGSTQLHLIARGPGRKATFVTCSAGHGWARQMSSQEWGL